MCDWACCTYTARPFCIASLGRVAREYEHCGKFWCGVFKSVVIGAACVSPPSLPPRTPRENMGAELVLWLAAVSRLCNQARATRVSRLYTRGAPTFVTNNLLRSCERLSAPRNTDWPIPPPPFPRPSPRSPRAGCPCSGARRLRAEDTGALLETADGGVGAVRRAHRERDPHFASHVGGTASAALFKNRSWVPTESNRRLDVSKQCQPPFIAGNTPRVEHTYMHVRCLMSLDEALSRGRMLGGEGGGGGDSARRCKVSHGTRGGSKTFEPDVLQGFCALATVLQYTFGGGDSARRCKVSHGTRGGSKTVEPDVLQGLCACDGATVQVRSFFVGDFSLGRTGLERPGGDTLCILSWQGTRSVGLGRALP